MYLFMYMYKYSHFYQCMFLFFQEEVAKSEQDEHIAVEDQEADVAEAHSSPKYGESDNDLDLWSSYKSEF